MKKIDEQWPGEIGPLMKKHIELRKAVGRVGEADCYCLFEFNEFLIKNYPQIKVPNRISILHFLQSKSDLSIGSKRNHVIYIRQFCKFLNQRGIRCYVPDKTLLPKYTYEPRYFPLAENHIIEFMKRARSFRYGHSLVGETYSVAIGLLWCTGMRVGELSRLTHQDVDFEKEVLIIRQTKFFKDRIVPINKTAIHALKNYIKLKEKYRVSCKKVSPFFVNAKGGAVPVHSYGTMFKRLIERMGLKDEKGRHPVLHDLRHNFATQWIHRFYKDTENYPPQSWMPKLSIFLGHTSMFQTQYYIHPDFELLMKASEQFTGMEK